MENPIQKSSGSPSELPQTANEAYCWVDQWLSENILWYRKKKKDRQVTSSIIRILCILMFSGGAICPLLSSALKIDINDWGYLLLATGAALLAIDKSFGLTSAWARLLATAMRLEATQATYRVKWAYVLSQAQPFDWSALCLEQVELASSVMQAETSQWMNETRAAFDKLSADGKG